ncbi:MAG: C45 family autoproteolytic acyltransferase/hydrolase [Anaerolineae bacterium]|jgi:isopenicillin-N N-acyltransferase-like protein
MELPALMLIEVDGPPLQRGQQQGEGAREQIHRALARYGEVIPKALKLTWREALIEARKFLPYGERAFPQFVAELRGIAQGAGVTFEEVWTLNCYEGLSDVQHEVWGCTCVAVRDDQTTGAHVLLAHNEDWRSADKDNVYLVSARPDEGPTLLAMTYGPLLVNIGLNAAGIGVAINSVYPTDGRVGVPRILCSRAVLAATTIGQAIRACVPKMRAGGYNYLLADANGELYSVETSATTHDLIYGDKGWLVHTNHYLSPKMQGLEEPGTYASSHVRLNRACRLLQAQLGQVTVDSLQTVLRDHVNYPNSICAHENPADPPLDRDLTLASLVMDLTAGVMWAAPGPPCQGDYVAHRL